MRLSNMKKKTIFTIFIIFSTLQSFSQISIEGSIIDSQTKESIPYATIRLLKSGSIISGTLSNEKGNFVLENILETNCVLEISFVAYSKKKIPLLLDKKNNNLQKIELTKEEQLLDEITVKAEKIKITELVDKSIIRFTEKQIKSKKDALEVLKIIPSIRIDLKTNAINMLGEENLILYINGIERQAIDLKSIKPNEIERVELITNPSAKYDSEYSAIINVILKKEITQGFFSNVRLNYYTQNIYNTSRASIQYGTEKLKINLAYSLFSRKSEGEEDVYLKSNSDETIFEYSSKKRDSKKRKQLGQFINYGFDYFVNENNTISFAANNGWYSQNVSTRTESKIFENFNLIEKHIFNIEPIYSRYAENYSFFFEHKFKKKGEFLIISSNLYNFTSDLNSILIDSIAVFDDTFFPNYIRTESSDLNKKIRNLKIDYTNLIKGKYKLETGYKFYTQDFSSFYHNGIELNSYHYLGYKNSIYTNFSFFQKNFSSAFGLRVEQLNSNISDTINDNYFHFLPYFSFLKKINKRNSIQLSFSRKLRYPTLQSLNSFMQYSDSMNIYTGNPYLKPSILNKYQLNYTFKKGDFYIKTKLYANNSNNKIATIITVNDNNIKYIKPVNIGKYEEYGVLISSSFNLFEILTLNPAINTFYKKYEVDKEINEGFSYEFSIAPEIFFDNELFIGFDFFIKGEDILTQGKEKSRPWFEIYAGMPILNKKGSLYLGVTPFNDLYEAVYDENNYYMERREVEKLQTVYLEFTYSFKKGKRLKKRKAKSIFEKDF